VLQVADSVTMSEAGTFDMPASTTWDAAAAPNFTLSGASLIATKNLGSQWNTVRATNPKTTGKWYAEMVTTGAPSAGDVGVGICRSTYGLNNFLGNGAGSTGIRSNGFGNNDGAQWAAGVADLTWANGTTIFIAVDAAAGLFWVAKNGGSMWNNNPAASPASGVGGIPLSGSGAVYLGGTAWNPPEAISINTGQSAFVGAVPSGFSRWG
jgi:hypothetical protein